MGKRITTQERSELCVRQETRKISSRIMGPAVRCWQLPASQRWPRQLPTHFAHVIVGLRMSSR